VSRQWLPLALLGAAIFAVLTVFRQPAHVPEPASGETEGTQRAAPSSSAVQHPADPPLDDFELRDSRLHLSHVLCEDDARRINELAGRDPNDAPAGMRTMSVCLRHGNVAWHKCILRATSGEQAATCNRRLLTGENVP
jgi:hypothetical protein